MTIRNKLFDNVLYELPVLAPDAGPVARLFWNGGAGRVFEGGIMDEIIRAIRGLSGTDTRQQYRQRGKTSAPKRYDWTVDTMNRLQDQERLFYGPRGTRASRLGVSSDLSISDSRGTDR